MSDLDLNALLVEWQSRLGLSDWRVSVRAGHPHAMGRNGIAGSVQHDLANRAARIDVLVDAPDDLIAPHDPEQVLCHELLHLVFAPFQAKNDESPKGVAQEQAINAIAWALIALKREAEPRSG